ncbi:MAG: glycosyltransferase family 4 protein [Kiritimatiellaeota bacterium]|nr:glycosyltransferase family 4 protein [Kiritimatiellota bacterium]
MKIAHYLKTLHLTGGAKVLAQHQEILKNLGHNVFWFVRSVETDFEFDVPITVIDDVAKIAEYELDVLIVNKPKDYFEVKGMNVGHLIYLSQAFEVDHMNIRREKKKKSAHSSPLGRLAMDFKWWLKKRRVHKLYAEKTVKWAVSSYLMELLEPYGCPTKLVRNSFDDALYHTKGKRRGKPLRLLSVGDYSLSRKNLPFLFEALAASSADFHFTRVSPNPITDEEKSSGLVDEFHIRIPEEQLSKIYRDTDVLISTSTDEGFGLPVIEAMASGALCVLSDIGAYRDFAKIAREAPKNYALFFNPRNPAELAAILDDVWGDYDKFEKARMNGMELTSFYTRAQTISDMETALAELV